MSKFDLSSLDSSKHGEEGTEIEIVHPVTGKGLGLYFGILGKHSKTFQDTVSDQTNARLRKDALNKRKGKADEVYTKEQVDANATELLVVATTHWYTIETDEQGNDTRSDVIHYQGQDLPFTEGNAKLIYENLLWLRDQVDVAIGDISNFIKA